MGLEPTTSSLGSLRSTTELYPRRSGLNYNISTARNRRQVAGTKRVNDIRGTREIKLLSTLPTLFYLLPSFLNILRLNCCNDHGIDNIFDSTATTEVIDRLFQTLKDRTDRDRPSFPLHCLVSVISRI